MFDQKETVIDEVIEQPFGGIFKKRKSLITIATVSAVVISALIAIISIGFATSIQKEPTDKELIEERINTFLTSYNDGDMDAAMSCLDAKSRNSFKALLSVLETIGGKVAGISIDLSDLFSLGIATKSGDFMDLKISNIKVSNDKSAVATTSMKLPGSGTKTIYFVMVYEHGGWYISDMTDEKVEISGNDSNQSEANIGVIEANSIFDGNGTIKFNMNNKTYTGIINAKGEIIYYSENSNIKWTSIGNGAGFITTSDDNDNKTYTLFNSDGQKTITVDNTVFDSIIGYGNGLILVYKNTSTITTEEHSYGVLDCNGNWAKPLTAGTKLPEPDGYYWDPYNYIGDGVFSSYNYYNDDYILFNSNTNKSYLVENCRIYSDCFSNGVIYGHRSYYKSYISDYSDRSKSKSLPSYFAIHADGTFEEVPAFTYAHGNLLISKESEYMSVLDKATNIKNEYTNFPSEMIYSVEFEGDYGLVVLNGADGKKYFTVIDKECNQKFDPISCKYTLISISDGRIVYKNSDNICEVIDVNGNVIVSKTQGFTNITDYYDGIARATNDSGEYFIGLDGKPLIITLKK